VSAAPPDPGAIAGLVARYAPGARRFLAWRAAAALPALLATARRGQPDWVMGMEAREADLVQALADLPDDPCLHLRGLSPIEPPPPGQAHPLLVRARHGLRPDVVLVGAEDAVRGALGATRLLPADGLLLAPPLTAEQEEAIARGFTVLERLPGLTALRPRRGAPPAAPRPPGRHAIIVTVVGAQTEAEWEITGPTVRAYAAAIDAELVVAREGAGLPGPTLKALSVPLAEAFDRVIMMDADILVRPHAPDLFALVPPEKVGAYPEARHFPRADIAAEAAAMHGVPPFPPEDYFNAGLMVLSRAHLDLVRAVGEGLVGGSMPEQNTINAALHRLALPLHRLDAEFNLIGTGRHLSDWRCGWMLHTAGAPKATFRRRFGWRREGFARGVVWTRQRLTGRGLRLPHMAAQAARIAGQEARVIDPDEIEVTAPRGFARMMPNGVAAIWIEPATTDAADWPAIARLPALAAGRWRLRAVPVPDEPLPDCALRVRDAGGAAPVLAGRLRAEAMFDLPQGAEAIEVALGGSGAGGALAGLVLLRDRPSSSHRSDGII
jgi:hypothetical protein